MDRLEILTRERATRKQESSATIRSQLSETKALESEMREKLRRLHREKVEQPESPQLTRKMDHLVNEIKITKGILEDAPFRIDVLKARLAASQEGEAVKRKILKTYQKSEPISELKKKSNLLLRRLKLAQQTNSELLALHQKRQQTEEATGQRINPGDVSGGFESLGVLLEFCEQENAGNGRKFTKWESIPFQKI